MRCEMCGKSSDSLVKAIVEDIELTVCSSCGSFGNVLKSVNASPEIKKSVERTQSSLRIVEVIVPDCPNIIKKARENLKLDQKNFASKINEKISIVLKIETGSYTPNLKLAYKLEKLLGIHLVENTSEIQESYPISSPEESVGMTLGDMIKKKD